MAAALRKKVMEAELQRIESSLNELLPKVNEANLAA